MADRLNELLSGLEQRVADRTKALTSSTKVSRRLSTILDQKQLVKEVVEQVKSEFGYYHAHIYLVDEASGDMIMAGGTGEAGKTMLANGHRVSKGKGLVGRAAETNEIVLVPDTSQDPNWLPNPLLPETKSEIAVPILAGEQVLGVLDVQHNIVDGLKEEDANLLQSIANQVAIALQNARTFTQAEQQRHQNELILGSAGEGIFGLDKQGNHTFVNPAGAEMLGYSTEELLGKHSHSMWHHTHADGTPFPGEECPIYATLRDGTVHQGEEYFIRKDGTGFYVNFSSVPIQEEGRTVGAVVTFADVTQQKRERELTAQHAKHQEALNLITQKIQNATTVENALQVAVRELGHSLGMQASVQLKPAISQEDRDTPVEKSAI
jgi:PAS domain S-box-containing protein